MGRNKVKMEVITNEAVRKATFRKRKAGLMKKANELKTLCGVDVCAIVYNNTEPEPEPHVWPSHGEAHRVLERFRNLPTYKQDKHMLNHENFAAKNLSDVELKIDKGQKKNRDLEMELHLMDHFSGMDLCDSVDLEDMKRLSAFLQEKVAEISNAIESIKDGDSDGGSSSSLA